MQAFLDLCASLGWPGLALLAFVAATLVPVGSEWLLAIQLTRASTTHAQLCLVVAATVANTAGGLLTYGLGRAGTSIARRDPGKRWPRLAASVRRYGPLAGLVGWAPVIGDPCTLLCGVARVPAGWFLFFSALGRFGRYLAVWMGANALRGP